MELRFNYRSPLLFKVLSFENEFKGFLSYEKKDRCHNYNKENEEKMKIPGVYTWKPTIKCNINYFMSATVWIETEYNERISKKIQFKETLNLGVSFRL